MATNVKVIFKNSVTVMHCYDLKKNISALYYASKAILNIKNIKQLYSFNTAF